MKKKVFLIDRIFNALKKAGEKGLTTTRLRGITPHFTYIISRLRSEGWWINTTKHPKKSNVFTYTLVGPQPA